MELAGTGSGVERLGFPALPALGRIHGILMPPAKKIPVFPPPRGKGKGCNAARGPAEGTARPAGAQTPQKNFSSCSPKAELGETGTGGGSGDGTGGKNMGETRLENSPY